MEEFVDYRARGGIEGMGHGPGLQSVARRQFAELIDAEAGEIALAPLKRMGENVVEGDLGLPGRGGNVVTVALHLQGSLCVYRELEKQGLEVRVVKPRRTGGFIPRIERGRSTEIREWWRCRRSQ